VTAAITTRVGVVGKNFPENIPVVQGFHNRLIRSQGPQERRQRGRSRLPSPAHVESRRRRRVSLPRACGFVRVTRITSRNDYGCGAEDGAILVLPGWRRRMVADASDQEHVCWLSGGVPSMLSTLNRRTWFDCSYDEADLGAGACTRGPGVS